MSNWNQIKIGDLFDVQVGGDLQTQYYSDISTDEHQYPIFSNSLVNNGLYGYTSKARYPANCVTITGRGLLGHAEYRNRPFDAIVRLLVLVPKNDVNCIYVTYYINSHINFAIESTGVPQLPAPRIKKTRIFIPDAPSEQKAIAGILSKVDEAIESVVNSIKAAERLKKSLMQNLLTGKLKPDGTWRSEVEFYVDEKFGKVPKGWEVKRVKDVFHINSETLPSKTDPDFKFRYITIEAVNTESIDFNSCPEYVFKESPGRARRIIKSGDILISGVRPNLKAFAIYEPPNGENWICSTGFFVLSQKNEEDNKFHFYQILSSICEAQFFSYVAGTNYPAIGDRDIRNMKLLRPPYDEQCQISDIIETISKANSKKILKIQSMKKVKKSLMQNLLTGKVRVDVEKINKLLEEV